MSKDQEKLASIQRDGRAAVGVHWVCALQEIDISGPYHRKSSEKVQPRHGKLGAVTGSSCFLDSLRDAVPLSLGPRRLSHCRLPQSPAEKVSSAANPLFRV